MQKTIKMDKKIEGVEISEPHTKCTITIDVRLTKNILTITSKTLSFITTRVVRCCVIN
jgi:hypothetical protein